MRHTLFYLNIKTENLMCFETDVEFHRSYMFNESQDNPLKINFISGVHRMAQLHLKTNWDILWSEQTSPRLNFITPQVHVSFPTFSLLLNLTASNGQCVVFMRTCTTSKNRSFQKKKGGGRAVNREREKLPDFWRCFQPSTSSSTWCLWTFKVWNMDVTFRRCRGKQACTVW